MRSSTSHVLSGFVMSALAGNNKSPTPDIAALFISTLIVYMCTVIWHRHKLFIMLNAAIDELTSAVDCDFY